MSQVQTAQAPGGVHVSRLKPDLPLTEIQSNIKKNGMSEVVIESGRDRWMVFGDRLALSQNNKKLPQVGETITLEVPERNQTVSGKVVLVDRARHIPPAVVMGATLAVGAGVMFLASRGGSTFKAVASDSSIQGAIIGAATNGVRLIGHGVGQAMRGVRGAILGGFAGAAVNYALNQVSDPPANGQSIRAISETIDGQTVE